MPSSKISKKEMEFLSTESEIWADEGIITPEQAENILSLYDVKPRNLRLIMLTAGIILLGLGAVSFMMAHWHELGKMFRVCIISAAYVASLAAYIFTGRETKTEKHSFFFRAGYSAVEYISSLTCTITL